MNLVGRQFINFTNKETGEVIKGVKLHFTGSDDRVIGQASLTQFIREGHACYQKALDCPFGEFTIIYGRNNTIQDIISNS